MVLLTGSTRLLTDGTGNVTDTYNYDPYGNITSRTGSTKQPYQWGGCYGYYTNYQDPEFKLIQMGYRFYDPEIGRFTQLDPIGDGINWYAYCDGNPLGGVDPWGLSVGDPGPWEGLIPIWGSGRAAINDYQNGDWLYGIGNTALAVSDVFLVKSAVTAVGKVGFKGLAKIGGSHNWGATRRWLGKIGFVEKGVPVHHWFIRQGGWLGKRLPKSLINQPWNLMPVKKELHWMLHSKQIGLAEKLWTGTPKGFKQFLASYLGRAAIGAVDDKEGGCR